jgi:dephospho-CoA kinase
MMVIWLSGYAGAGKDTMASILWKKYDLQRVAFADSLKDFVAVKYGLERSLCDTPEGKNSLDVRTGKTVRELLIADSAEAKKENINIFASYVLDKINTSKQRGFVISDWRYPHEYEYIKKHD